MTKMNWTTDQASQQDAKATAEFLISTGAHDALDKAFAEGVLIDYATTTRGEGLRDLEIKLVFRHKSTVD